MVNMELDIIDFSSEDPKKKKPVDATEELVEVARKLGEAIRSDEKKKGDYKSRALYLIETEGAEVKYNTVTAFWETLYGEQRGTYDFARHLMDLYFKSDSVSQKHNDLLLIGAADKGQWISIEHFFNHTSDISQEAVQKALRIAVAGNKTQTTREIINNTDLYDTDTLILLSSHSDAGSDIKERLLKTINARLDGILVTQTDHSNAIKAATNTKIKNFYIKKFKRYLEDKWDLASNHEISCQSHAFGTTLTKIFNFKANTVKTMTKPKGENSFIETHGFRAFENKSEIDEAFDILKMFSPEPPIYQRTEKGPNIKMAPLKTIGK